MARPKVTKAMREHIITALRAGADMNVAARAVGCSVYYIKKRMTHDPEFKAAVLSARQFADELVEKSLFDQARKGHVVACIFWLKNRQPERWMDTYQKQQTGEITVKIVRGEDESRVQLPGALVAEVAAPKALKN